MFLSFIMLKIIQTIFIVLVISFPVAAEEIGIKDVNAVIEKAEKLKDEIRIDEINNPAAQKAAEKAAQYFHSEECQTRIKSESQRLKKEVLQEYVRKQETPKSLSETERIFIFVSSSMPISTLRTYAAEIENIGDRNIVMVLRGFVGGMEKSAPTMAFCKQVLMFDPDCKANDCEAFRAQIQIDPNLFRQFGINEVPAMVYAQNVHLVDPEQSAGIPENTKGRITGYKLYGAVPIEYALDKFYQESKSSNLKGMLSQIRGSRQ